MENKLCPWCMTEFTEENKGVYCPSCGIKHHRSCFESKGCANPDCGKVTDTPKPKSAEEIRQEYESRKKAEERTLKEKQAKERYEADLEAIMNDKPLPSEVASTPKKSVGALVLSIIGLVLSFSFFIVGANFNFDSSGFMLPFIAVGFAIFLVTKIVTNKIALKIIRIVGIVWSGTLTFISFILFISEGYILPTPIFSYLTILFIIDLVKKN
jgi:hypothetical protein